MSLTGTLTSATGETTVDLSCKANGGDAVAAAGAVLTATRVQDVSIQ
jgi:hypothetical protein